MLGQEPDTKAPPLDHSRMSQSQVGSAWIPDIWPSFFTFFCIFMQILIAPWWLAAVYVINPTLNVSSWDTDQTENWPRPQETELDRILCQTLKH